MPKKQYKRRADGRYQSQIYVGMKNGKRSYKSVYGATVRELEKNVQELKLKMGKGIDLSSCNDTFGFWGERWLKLKKLEVSAGRYVTYCARYKNLEPLYDLNISRIKATDIQEIIIDCASEPNERTGKPLAKKTLIEIKNTAKQIIQLAIVNRVLDYNCAVAVKIPKSAEKSTRRALTDEEQRWITDTPHRAQTAAMIMMYAGLRRGELLALTWQDIDLSAGTIAIKKAVEYINGHPHVKEGGKTDAATRTVYIPRRLIEYLSALPQSRIGLVVPMRNGGVMTDTAWRRLWESYLTDLNIKYGDWKNCVQTGGKQPKKYAPIEKPFIIPRITPHWLRHTYITMLYMAGVDVLTAKAQAGHADIKTTMEIYTHLDEQYKRRNISKLDNYLEGLV